MKPVARRNVGIIGTKIGFADAEIVANILRGADPKFSVVHDDEIRQLRNQMCLCYEWKQAFVAKKQRLIGLLDLVSLEYKNYSSDIFGTASRELFSQYYMAKEIRKIYVRKLTQILKDASKGRMGRDQA